MMKKGLRSWLAPGLIAVTCLAGSVCAEIVRIEVEGVVDEITTTGSYSLDGSVVVGTVMSGYAIYDTAAADEYDYVYPLLDITMSVGDYVFGHDPAGPWWPTFEVFTDNGYAASSNTAMFEGMVLRDGEPIAWEDQVWGGGSFKLIDALLSGFDCSLYELPDAETFPPFSTFTRRAEFRAGFARSGEGFAIKGYLTDVRAVPEPGTVVLFAWGVLAAARRQKRA